MLLLVSLSWACEEPTPPERVESLVQLAETSFQAMDLEGFEAARSGLLADLACLVEPADPELVGRIHQIEALGRFAQGQPSTPAWHAAIQADGALQLDPALAGEGHPLRQELEAARGLGEGATETLGSELLVDAHRSDQRPLDRPSFVQHPERSWYLLESQPTPVELLPLPPVEPERDRLALGLTAGAVGSAALAGGLYTGAWKSRSVFDDPATPYEDLDALRSRTNALSTGSAVAGGLALGLAVGGGLAWSF